MRLRTRVHATRQKRNIPKKITHETRFLQSNHNVRVAGSGNLTGVRIGLRLKSENQIKREIKYRNE